MLEVSNIEPITGVRRAYFEDLRKNNVPQFLFRTWSSKSGGGPEHATNSVKEIIPHGFMERASGSGFYEKAESELYKMVAMHFSNDNSPWFSSEFSSWTGSLHLALYYARSIDEQHDPHVAVIDTRQLDEEVLVWHVPHLYYEGGLHEYMAHGPIRGIGYKAVSYKALMSSGLANVFPELGQDDISKFGFNLRNQMFNGPPNPFPEDEMENSDEIKQIRKIADLYDHLSLPVATGLICLRPRPWIRSQPEGRAALEQAAKLFAGAELPSDFERGNWLREGVVLTESHMDSMTFPDVRQ
ncbi:hypothetical protein J4E93_006257 [Alternaria ventricosa]|uniref:uncharacterized protein n=1 Tax=Alternaria ventricosa TaxID=1187951 RepID=UPI0020C27717|nr:uncharacterized protein J4E93_006257 [Alternaria ventricosa]KAI4644356.1 hypothetical protein J4E93_006257 [Alternaria ventricosa]